MQSPTRQALLDYVSEFVQVKYIHAECGSGVNQDDDTSSLHHIRLMNAGDRPIVGGDWTIYFNHANGLDETLDMVDDLIVRHVDGWLFTLTLRRGRVLRPFSNLTMRSVVRLASRSYAFPRWYRVA